MCSMIGASAAETHCASKSDVSSPSILPPVVNPGWPCFADLAALAHGVSDLSSLATKELT